jgi:phage/plasmid primase-like uncharacterized protein
MEDGRHSDPVADFAEALRNAGLVVRGAPIMDDRIHRVPVEGKPSGLDGAYNAVIRGDRAFGWYQNWLIHEKPVAWHAGSGQRMTREERRHLADIRRDHDAARDSAVREQQERAAIACQTLWDAAKPVDTHPYLRRKDVPSYGLRQGVAGQEIITIRDGGEPHVTSLEGKLFVPMRDLGGKLWSIQYIRDDGMKRYHPGGRKEGCHFVIGPVGMHETPMCIAEGYATAASVFSIADAATVAAFDSGNLLPVAQALRERHPSRALIVAGDNDHARERETVPDGKPRANVGREAAERAAKAVGGVVALPHFAADEPALSDWNDYLTAHGLEPSRAAFRREIDRAQRQTQESKRR